MLTSGDGCSDNVNVEVFPENALQGVSAGKLLINELHMIDGEEVVFLHDLHARVVPNRSICERHVVRDLAVRLMLNCLP